jgi:hypothetical protein
MRHLLLVFCLLIGACSSFSGSDVLVTPIPDTRDADVADAVAVSVSVDSSDAGDAVTVDADVADATACDGGPSYKHSSSVGGEWTDCVLPYTYNADQAMKACQAYCAPYGCTCSVSSVCGRNMVLASPGVAGRGEGWGYEPPTGGQGSVVGKIVATDCTLDGTWG